MTTNFVINLTHYGYDGARLAPEAMKFTSRILQGLVVCRGLVEPRRGIGLIVGADAKVINENGWLQGMWRCGSGNKNRT